MIYSPCDSPVDRAKIINQRDEYEANGTKKFCNSTLESVKEDLAILEEEISSLLNSNPVNSSGVWSNTTEREKLGSSARKTHLLRQPKNDLEKKLERTRLKNRELNRQVILLKRKLAKCKKNIPNKSEKLGTKWHRKQELKPDESSQASKSILFETWGKLDAESNKTCVTKPKKYPQNCSLCGKQN